MRLALTAALLGTAVPAKADVTADLDQCLADPTKTQAVFTERFPHERCDIATTCDPKLVQSAATLARERCRQTAIDACGGGSECLSTLSERWTSRAAELSAELSVRWANTDPATLPKLTVRRLSRAGAFALNTACADETGCSEQALQNLIRMERIDSYLPALQSADVIIEGRQGIEGWYKRCSAASPGRLTNTVQTDWPGFHNCVMLAAMQCRFVPNPKGCIDELHATLVARSERLKQNIPDKAGGEGLDQRFAQTALDFYNNAVETGTESNFVTPSDKELLAWLGAEMQATFVLHLFYLNVLPSLREQLNLQAVK